MEYVLPVTHMQMLGVSHEPPVENFKASKIFTPKSFKPSKHVLHIGNSSGTLSPTPMTTKKEKETSEYTIIF